MPTTVRHNASRAAVSDFTLLRFLGAMTWTLLIAALIASSSARGMVLGDAAAQSALGSPLRVVIPITAAPGESLRQDCFRLGPTAGEGSAQIVTARVSLERATSAPRLVVTTANAINEPAIRFSLEANCDASVRRTYVLLLDPPASGAYVAMAASGAATREPRQGRVALQPAAARRNSSGSAFSATQIVHVPESAESGANLAATATESTARDRIRSSGAIVPTALRQVPASSPLAAVALSPAPMQPGWFTGTPLWIIGSTLVVVAVVGLLAVFTRRRSASPEIPQWTRSPAASGPRSFADLSAAPRTLSHTLSHAGATTQPQAKPRPSAAASLTAEASTSRGGISRPVVDPSTIDTLLDEVDPDIVEERAVREAWAAARSDVEREMDGNAILQAIEAAERELYLAPQPPAQSAIERALDDDLLQPVRPH